MNFAPRHTFLLVLGTVLLLFAASYFEPSDSLSFVRKVDIVSDLRSDAAIYKDAGYEQVDTGRYLTQVTDTIVVTPQKVYYDTMKVVAQYAIPTKDSAHTVKSEAIQKMPTVEPTNYTSAKGVPAIEDFSGGSLNAFLSKLKNVKGMNRPVRIAVLGDSFIEGDIFTQDLRELLQRQFGGRGVGFVPVASGVAGFRQTVKHTFKGWNTHCITSNLKRGGYVLSSYTFTPTEANSVSYSGSGARAYLSDFSRARFMFVNRKNSKIKAVVNSGAEQLFSPPPSSDLQQIVVFGDSIRNIRFEVESSDGFTGYGAFLDATRGVSVDNFSVRGNSGVTLISTDAQMLRQMNSIAPYDLIMLEYGLNVAQADVKNYNTYLMQMKSAVTHLKASFPDAVIVIMSVPDRARRTADGFVTMPGIEAMARVQRELAQSVGGCYWSTLDAMKARGGMGAFVKQGWAAKDYTHLSSKGGRELARDFYDALMGKFNGGN